MQQPRTATPQRNGSSKRNQERRRTSNAAGKEEAARRERQRVAKALLRAGRKHVGKSTTATEQKRKWRK